MTFDPQTHHRRSIRLEGYDYTQAGAYFVTIATWRREPLFGEVVDGEMRLNRYGAIVRQAWLDLPLHYPQASLDAFIIMPNHVHGIVVLQADDGDGRGGSVAREGTAPSGNTSGDGAWQVINQTRPYEANDGMRRHGLPEIVCAFKSFSARRINQMRKEQGIPVWQRNYFERIIRDEPELNRIRQYIHQNPTFWQNDPEHLTV